MIILKKYMWNFSSTKLSMSAGLSRQLPSEIEKNGMVPGIAIYTDEEFKKEIDQLSRFIEKYGRAGQAIPFEHCKNLKMIKSVIKGLSSRKGKRTHVHMER